MSPAKAAWLRVAAGTTTAVALLEFVSAPEPAVRSGAVAALAAVAAYSLATIAVASALVGGSSTLRHRAALRAGLLGVLAANEEILWRRLALGELLRWGALSALAASTVAFALGHRSRPALHLVTGAAFGGLYLATGALTACVCAHWSYNVLVDRPAERAPGT